MTVLKVQDLSIKYTEQQRYALNRISFQLQKGEVLILTGESGSGKSSLLRLIAGLEEPSSGVIELDGEKVVPPSEKLVPGHPNISLVYQQFDIEPNLNVYKNIDTVLREYTREYRHALIEELLDKCSLRHLKEKKPWHLSGGEQQRLAIARAISQRPRLLLMDEPFSNQDVFLKESLKEAIYDLLKKFEVSTIIVTHDTRDALSMSDRLAVIEKGNLLQIGKPETIYSKPVNSYVAKFFGICNIFSGTDMDNSGLRLPENYKTCKMCIRAEDIKPGADKGFLKGSIIHERYFGAEREYVIQCGTLDFKVLTTKKEKFEIGEETWISWNWEDVVLLED